MSNEPLLNESRNSSLEMTNFKDDDERADIVEGDSPDGLHRDLPGTGNLSTAPRVPTRKQRLSDLFTILCSGCALISDGE